MDTIRKYLMYNDIYLYLEKDPWKIDGVCQDEQVFCIPILRLVAGIKIM